MDEFVDAVTGGALWGIGFGAALAAVRLAGGGLRPVAKTAIKGAVVAGDWVRNTTEESRETIQDLYYEVKAERGARA